LRKTSYAHHTDKSNWEILSQRRKLTRTCTLFKIHLGELSWKAVGDRLQRSIYINRFDYEWKIRNRRQRTEIGKRSFVNRTILLLNRLRAENLWSLRCEKIAFRNRVRKVINLVNWRIYWCV